MKFSWNDVANWNDVRPTGTRVLEYDAVLQLNHTWRQFQSTRSKSRNNRLWVERLDILILSPARNNEYDSFERLLKIELVNVYFVRKNMPKSVTMAGRNRENNYLMT